MQQNRLRSLLLAVLLGIMAFLTAACDASVDGSYGLQPVQHEVDPVFRDFYELLGGSEVLGPAISPLFTYSGVRYQYTVASLMVFDEYRADGQRFYLGALGLDMDIAEPPVQQPEVASVRYINGHVIYAGFVNLYEKLSGIRFVGKPLTEVHYNAAKRRYEQYFENLGFYYSEDSPAEEVHLLAYGAWKCDESCRKPPLEVNEVVLPYRVATVFSEGVERLGPAFTGFALSEVYQTPDGFTEQVFENLVLALDPSQPARIIPRALSTRLGYQPELLRPMRSEPGYYFYPIQGDQGYNLPLHVWEYLLQHGGIEISGPPIGELFPVKGNLNRLCFTNLCLDEETSPDGTVTVRAAGLGYSYLLLPVLELKVTQALPEYPAPAQPQAQPSSQPAQEPAPLVEAVPVVEPVPLQQAVAPPEPAPPQDLLSMAQTGEMSVQVWESLPMVGPNQSQEIGVSVFVDGAPAAELEPDLVVTLPDGDRPYYLYPTGADGQSRQVLEPINAPNGTLIPYEVCIFTKTRDRFCVRDSFLIWQNP
jgi:hypothetical protein